MAGGVNLSLEALGVNLPYSMEAEQAVLGAALIDAELIPKMVESLRPEMFYARQNGEIFSEMMRLFTASSPVDFVTLLAAVQDAGVFATEDEAKVYLNTPDLIAWTVVIVLVSLVFEKLFLFLLDRLVARLEQG